MLKRMMLLGAVLTGLLTVFGALVAQSNEIILTIGLEAWQADMLNERVLQGFYDTHPGVKIVPIVFEGDEAYFGLDATDMDGSLDKAEAYFRRADVLSAHQYNLSPLYTRAGYVLDLTPYLRADGSGAVEDFQPAALKMFEWDEGVWALPATLSLTFIAYDEEAFDMAGYPHPDSSWTLDDYLSAGQALTVRDTSGVVTRPGFYGFDDAALIRLLSGKGFYDGSTQPETIRLNDPEIEAMLASLDAYNKELLGDDPENSTVPQTWDWSQTPIQMGGAWLISDDNGSDHPFVPVLPGDTALVSGEGYSISAGTQYPDLAYELVTYLTGNIEVAARFYSQMPVRQSLRGQMAEDFEFPPVPEALEDILPTIMDNGIPSSELRYGEYLDVALSKMADDENMSFHEALQQAQEQAVSDLGLAEARVGTPVVVSTPVPTPVLSAGEIALRFAFQPRYWPMPNQDDWDRITQEFIDADPEVGYIEFDTNYRDSSEQFKEIDCAYTPYNQVPSVDLSQIQALDPFLAVDSSFDRSDVPEIVWSQVTRDEKTYGLPMTLLPLMMWYNPDDFEAAGVFPPEMGWTISDFISAMTLLKQAQPDKKPYRSQNYGNAPYVLLAAGLGGVPIDYSAYMPAYHLTDPAVVEALRQTLDLAKQEYIDYIQLEGASKTTIVRAESEENPSLYDAPGYIDDWSAIGTEASPHLPVTFPRGAETIPLSFDIGVAYISAQTPYAEACYRWLTTLFQHLELFLDMPARVSFANSEILIAAQGQSASDFYMGLFDLMKSPQAVVVPAGLGSTNSSVGAYIAEIWFNQALDAYVLEDAELETVLADAQTFIDEYRACTVDIAPLDPTAAGQDDWEAYYKQFTDCAVAVDPSLAPRFEGGMAASAG